MSKHTLGPWTVGTMNDPRTDLGRGQYNVFPLPEDCEVDANARLIAAAPALLHALKWATEYVCLFTGDGAGVTGVQQGHDRGRFRDEETGEICPENLRSFLLEVIEKAQGGE